MNGEIIKDLGTGLEWQRCTVGMSWNANTQTCVGSIIYLNWDDAMMIYGTQDEFGFRLPTIAELRTLVYCNNDQPVRINMRFNDTPCDGAFHTIVPWAFPNLPGNIYWSSTFDKELESPWSVHFWNGHVSTNLQKHNLADVRLVRSGQ